MSDARDAFSRWLARLVDVLTWLAGVLLLLMLVLINVEVVARYIFGTSTLIADGTAPTSLSGSPSWEPSTPCVRTSISAW